jgi:hypothetical protein
MAVEQPSFCITLEAAEDLSAKQYYFMKLDSNGRATTCTGATDVPVGVLQNKPNALGKAAEILVYGMTKVSSDAALTIGDLIGTSADGQADAKTPGIDTTEYVTGQVLIASTAAAGLATALVNCANPHRAR